ncbi:MAG TPA: mechanosensitive ion channel domain-containing protein [Armatimonadota bacterium]
MEQIVAKLQEWVVLYGLKVVAAIVILLIGRFAAGSIRSVTKRLLQKGHVDDILVSFISSLCYVGIMAFVLIAALGQLGVQTTSFVAILGAAGLAIGLALQGSLANFAAGILMIVFKPFKLGDYIEGGGVAGVVEHMGIFTTELLSTDNKKIIIPNGKLTSDSIINYTAEATRRVDLVVGVSYGDDLGKVKTVLQDILAHDERVLQDPAPTVGVLELAANSVKLVVRPWVKTADYWSVFFAVQENIKSRFDAEGISMPFPQQDVHLHHVDGPVVN